MDRLRRDDPVASPWSHLRPNIAHSSRWPRHGAERPGRSLPRADCPTAGAPPVTASETMRAGSGLTTAAEMYRVLATAAVTGACQVTCWRRRACGVRQTVGAFQ